MNEQQDDYKYMANLIANQAKHICEQQEHIDALLKLVDAYRRNHDCCPCAECRDDARADIKSAEKEYEQTIKR